MTSAVEQRLDFSVACGAAGREWNDAPWQAALRKRAVGLANRLDWPDSRAERPWKYYDAARIGLSPETPLAGARRKVMVQKFARHAALRLHALRDPGVTSLSV